MLDPVTQQYYLRARFYNPVIGRFTQEDTYYGDGLNLYQYCQANPVGYVDPSGHNCETTQSRYNSNEEQHPKANAADAYQSATEKKSVKKDGSESGSNTVNPKDVNFMQSSIKNQTGEHTVLGNAEALKSGALKATDLPEIRIWQDADGKLWTLDHRRLAAFRMAELDSVPFRWATDEEVANQMWKMTTKTNGISIKLKLADGQSMTIQ